MSAIIVLSVGVPVYAGSVHQDYTGAKSVMAGESPLVQSTFDMMIPEKEENFRIEAYDIGESSAKLKWSSDKVYLGYNIYMFNPITHNFEEYATANTSSISFTNLNDDSSYKFMVSSGVNDEMLGIVSFKTESLKPQLKIKTLLQTVLSLRLKILTAMQSLCCIEAMTVKNLKKSML